MICKLPPKLADLVQSIRGESVFHRCCDSLEFWNQIPYQLDDLKIWHTPAETLAQGHAVCHDYAVGNYFTLGASGIPWENMAVCVVRLTDGEMHAVLHAEDSSDAYILDNRHDSVRSLDDCDDLTPLYGLNHKELIIFNHDWTTLAVRKPEQDSDWTDLMSRIAKEGGA